tara:strand:+ start:6734 stop:7030 length:297 start_codon:yes stop_codon:yes gene_type:complete
VIEEDGIPKMVVALPTIFTQIAAVNILAFVTIHAFGGEGLKGFWGVFVTAVTGDGLVSTLKGERSVFGVIKSDLGPWITLEVTMFAGLPQITLMHIVV